MLTRSKPRSRGPEIGTTPAIRITAGVELNELTQVHAASKLTTLRRSVRKGNTIQRRVRDRAIVLIDCKAIHCVGVECEVRMDMIAEVNRVHVDRDFVE